MPLLLHEKTRPCPPSAIRFFSAVSHHFHAGADKRRWHTKTGQGYLFKHKALAKVLRGKLLAAMTEAGLNLPEGHPPTWVVDCKQVGSGEKALVYLGRDPYRGVFQEKDILACDHGQVNFRYRNSKTRRTETRTLPGATFLWLLLQHVLPKDFRRARHLGFLHANSKRRIQLLHLLRKLVPNRGFEAVNPRPPLLCPCCGGPMTIVRTLLRPPFARPEPPSTLEGALAM